MTRRIALTANLALTLASCGAPKALALPTDPVDRAATCAIVAAAEARSATADASQPLTLAAQGHILHYALLAASQDGSFSAATAGAVVARMRALQESVINGKWQDLQPACRAAFPAAVAAADPALPDDRLHAQLGCSGLAQFTATALEADTHYAAQTAQYRQLRAKLSDRMGGSLRARVGADLSAQRAAGDEAMAAVAQLGSPVAVLDQCLKTFG